MRVIDTTRAGELRNRATFKIQPTEGDTTGYVEVLNSATDLTTWATRGESIPCKITMERGLEASEGDRDVSKLYKTLTMRYDSACIPEETDAVICNEKRYGIISVGEPEDGRRRQIKVQLREVK